MFPGASIATLGGRPSTVQLTSTPSTRRPSECVAGGSTGPSNCAHAGQRSSAPEKNQGHAGGGDQSANQTQEQRARPGVCWPADPPQDVLSPQAHQPCA